MFSPRRFPAIAKNICSERTYPQGRGRTSRSLGAEDKLRPAIRPGARSAVRPTALLGFQSLRRFAPDREWRNVSICRACVPFADSFAAINFRRGIGRLEGNVDLKKTNDHELVVAASRLHSRVRSTCYGFLSAARDPAMGFASCRISDLDSSRQPRGHDPAWIISLRKPFPAPIRSWVLRQTSNEMISWPIARCSLRGELPRRSATQALRGSPVHPFAPLQVELALLRPSAGPYSVFKGLMPRRPERRCRLLGYTPASRRLPV